MNITFHQSAFADYQQWTHDDIKIFTKITGLIKEIYRTPFMGTGKPEPLKGKLAGFWSRRITGKHRLIYKIDGELLVITACKSHYSDK
jgi:toxin YoeB